MLISANGSYSDWSHEIAVQAADVLHFAPERVVDDRSDRSGNMMITPDQRVKLMEFELADFAASRIR